MRRARDVMNASLVAIKADATVEDAIHCLLEHRVTGAPVVDEHGGLVGIISEFQLLEAIYRPEVKQERVSDLMTKHVISVAEAASLSEVANKLLLHRIRRVPVVRGDTVVGIISRRDLLRHVHDPEHEQGQPAAQIDALSGANG